MEIAIHFNENARAITREEAHKQMTVLVLSQLVQRKQAFEKMKDKNVFFTNRWEIENFYQ